MALTSKFPDEFVPTEFISTFGYDIPLEPKTGPVGISIRGLKEFYENMNILEEYLTDVAVRVLALIAVDLLATAQPRVPYQKGLLRQSGTALVMFGKGKRGGYHKIVGRGRLSPDERPDAGIDADLSGLEGRTKGVSFISANVTYSRTGDEGEDVAVFTHFFLLPFTARPAKPAARHEGTGPLYLESAWNDRKDQYFSWLKNAYSYDSLERDISQMVTGGGEKTDKFEVKIPKLRRRRRV